MISIITPVLNGGSFIEKTIKSISELQIPFEHIIVDGGSTDGTLEILDKYPNLKVLHQQNGKGMYHAIDLGFEKAEGEIFTWVNSDDIVLKDGYEKLYTAIIDSKCDVVFSDAFFINIQGKRIKTVKGKYFPKLLLKHGIFPFVQPSAVFTKNIYYQVGGFDWRNFKIVGDLDLFYKFSNLKGITFKKINAYSVEFLKYGESLGDKNLALGTLERKRAKIPTPNLIIRIINKILSF